MADEKLNTGQEQTEQPSLFDTGPEVPAPEPPANAPEQTTVETDGAPGGVVVSAEQIEKLMAERNAKARAECLYPYRQGPHSQSHLLQFHRL